MIPAPMHNPPEISRQQSVRELRHVSEFTGFLQFHVEN